MSGWRTNRRTKNKFPVENRWGQKIDEEIPEDDPAPESESQYVETHQCGACSKIFTGQAYELDGVVICSECNRLDNRIERAERAQQAQQQAVNPVPYVSNSPYASGSGSHRGGASSCSKCGHIYSPGESHQQHWDSVHGGA
jgi:hypothetical protein